MCLLVISNCFEAPDRDQLHDISENINALIDRARVARRPLAFLQGPEGVSFDGIGLRIGRYEPIFTVGDFGGTLPSGLIDFIVGRSERQIQLAGVAEFSRFERLRRLLRRCGYTATMDFESVLFVDQICADGAMDLPQLMENDPFTKGLIARSASKKNQSTRWPNA